VAWVQEAEILDVDRIAQQPQPIVVPKEAQEDGESFDQLVALAEQTFNSGEFVRVKQSLFHHLSLKITTKEQYQTAIKVLREAQLRCVDITPQTAKNFLIAATKTQAFDEAMGLLHRSRRMAKYLNGDNFVFRFFPPAEAINHFLHALITNQRHDLVPPLIRVFRSRFNPHLNSEVESSRRVFYTLLLRWVREIGDEHQTAELVKEIESAEGLHPEKYDELFSQLCACHVLSSTSELSKAPGTKFEKDFTIMNDIFQGDAQRAAAAFAQHVDSDKKGKAFYRTFRKEISRIEEAKLTQFLEAVATQKLSSPAATCLKQCKAFLEPKE